MTYLWSTTTGCQDIGLRKLQFVARIKFLCMFIFKKYIFSVSTTPCYTGDRKGQSKPPVLSPKPSSELVKKLSFNRGSEEKKKVEDDKPPVPIQPPNRFHLFKYL